MNARKERERMELKVVKEWLEGGGGGGESKEEMAAVEGWEESTTVKFFDAFTMKGVATDLIEPGHLLCSFQVPPRLTNLSGNYLHSGAVASLVDLVGSAVFFTTGAATSGVSVDINVSYLEAIYVHCSASIGMMRSVDELDTATAVTVTSTSVAGITARDGYTKPTPRPPTALASRA
ncbi:acyl-coenzyme A thioesterase 13-like [Iris pallida]|uniref:Acyl-coenzyme A thioesterase 13-like n=1 Tax=Iris pallida TaxID=29817 RepID=A0AAX6HTG1_IRIPA|nr:acyl-coenzyme A thioesterase 13-like [Iris pallida]